MQAGKKKRAEIIFNAGSKNKRAKVNKILKGFTQTLNKILRRSTSQTLKHSQSQVQLGLKVQVYKLNWGSIRASSSSSSIRASVFQLGLQLGFVWVSNFS